MHNIIVDKCAIWICFLFNLAAVTCYPTGRTDQLQVAAHKNEMHYPNGTVVGKYSYMDKEGNPVQVKYYADDASYGVELNSIKVADGASDLSTINYLKDYPEKPLSNVPDNVLSAIEQDKHFKNDPFEFINKEMNKIKQHKLNNPHPDFEIYYQNELNGPKKCGKEKVRVYFDKERKMRSVLNKIEADTYCEKF